jgi:hypothetical protein
MVISSSCSTFNCHNCSSSKNLQDFTQEYLSTVTRSFSAN